MAIGKVGGSLKCSISVAQHNGGSAGEVEFSIAIEIGGNKAPCCHRRYQQSGAKCSVTIPGENLYTGQRTERFIR